MFLDIIFFIYSIVFVIIGIKRRYKILLIFSTIALLFSLSSVLLRVIFALQYFPYIRVTIYLILFVLTVSSFSLKISKKIGVILTIVILIMSCLAFYIYESLIGVVFKNFDGKNHVGIYLDFTVGTVEVTYYEKKGLIFMANKYSFVDTYLGIIIIYDGLFDYEPNYRNLNENN